MIGKQSVSQQGYSELCTYLIKIGVQFPLVALNFPGIHRTSGGKILDFIIVFVFELSSPQVSHLPTSDRNLGNKIKF